jgi:hypothetical protein
MRFHINMSYSSILKNDIKKKADFQVTDFTKNANPKRNFFLNNKLNSNYTNSKFD